VIDKVSQILPGVLGQLQQQTKRKRYREDPVLWCREYLGLQLWSKQREILRSIKENRNTAVAAGHGVGKDVPLDTPIATPTGWSTIGELQVGSQVYDENGKPCTVTGKSKVFNLPLFRTTFSDGASVVSSGFHEWSTIDHKAAKRARRSAGGVKDWRDHWNLSSVRETHELSNTLTYTNGDRDGAGHIVPNARALEGVAIKPPIDPYILGAWLGDGTSSAANMTIGDQGLFIIGEFEKLGYTLTKLPSQPYGYTFARQGFMELLRSEGLWNNKHIPREYFRASIEQRMALLRGIMDTDGFVCHDSVCGIDLMNKKLAYGVVELIRSLGARASITPARTYLDGRDVGLRYRMVFNPTFSPFTAGEYQDVKYRANGDDFFGMSRRTMRTIVSVEPVDTVPTQCIEVDSPSHLYLVTEDLIPTHNSFIASIAMAWWVDVHPWNAQDTFVASTAPFQDQITTILWDNLRSIHSESHRRYAEGLVDHPLPGYITSTNLWKLDSGETIGQGRKPPDGREDAGYQGKHATYLFAVGDEAAGLSSGMIDALGNISTGEFNRRLLIANPTDPNCAMAKLWDKPDTESTWNLMHISVLDSPMITKEEGFDLEKAGGMSGMDYVDQARQDWGEDDPRYIARVLGQWSFESGNTIYMETEIAKAVGAVVLPDPDGIPELGVDIARMGSDKSFVYKIEHGQVWETDPETSVPVKPTEKLGVRARLVDSWAKAPLTGDDPKNLGSAERIHKLALEMGVKIVKIDASGIGGGVIDGLATLNKAGNYVVVEIFGGAAASDKREYLNARAEGFFDLKTRFRGGLIDIDSGDDKLLDELRGMLYEHTDKGQIKVEAKDSMKRRGKSSPDRADALWYACFDARELVNPTTQPLQNGDRVMYDPYEFTGLSFEGAGLPV